MNRAGAPLGRLTGLPASLSAPEVALPDDEILQFVLIAIGDSRFWRAVADGWSYSGFVSWDLLVLTCWPARLRLPAILFARLNQASCGW